MISKEEMKLRREKVIKHWEINKDKGRFITELAKECNVTPKTYRKYLREVGYDPKLVLDYLYKDTSIYLDRKYARYRDLSTINSAKSVKA